MSCGNNNRCQIADKAQTLVEGIAEDTNLLGEILAHAFGRSPIEGINHIATYKILFWGTFQNNAICLITYPYIPITIRSTSKACIPKTNTNLKPTLCTTCVHLEASNVCMWYNPTSLIRPSILRHKSRKPKFLVQIYMYTTTMTKLIRHSKPPKCHIIE